MVGRVAVAGAGHRGWVTRRRPWATPWLVIRVAVGLLLVGEVLTPSPGLGQDRTTAPATPPGDAEIAEARALFMAGQSAVEAGRWADALERFERSYALSHAPSALFNVAFALRSLGRHREARDAFDRLRAQHPGLDAPVAREAERLRAEEAERVAALHLHRLDAALRYELRLDGERVDDGGDRPLVIETDPGDHVISVTDRQSTAPFVWEGTLVDGQREAIDVSFAPGAEDPPSATNGSLWSSPWLWAAVVAVVAAGLVTAYFVNDAAQLEPLSDRWYEL